MLVTSIVEMTKKHFSSSKQWLNASGLVKVFPLYAAKAATGTGMVSALVEVLIRLSGWCVRCSSGSFCWNMFEHQLHRLLDAALIKQNGPAPGPSGQASTWQL